MKARRKLTPKLVVASVLGAALVFSLVACLVLYWQYRRPSAFSVEGYERDNEDVVQYEIEYIGSDTEYELGFQYIGRSNYIVVQQRGNGTGTLIVQGWAYIPEVSIGVPGSFFVLYNADTGIYYSLNTKAILDDARTEQYGQGKYNYNLSGLHATASLRSLPQGEYQLLLAYANDGYSYLVDTAEYVEVKGA